MDDNSGQQYKWKKFSRDNFFGDDDDSDEEDVVALLPSPNWLESHVVIAPSASRPGPSKFDAIADT
jgi:hypothetical protein